MTCLAWHLASCQSTMVPPPPTANVLVISPTVEVRSTAAVPSTHTPSPITEQTILPTVTETVAPSATPAMRGRLAVLAVENTSLGFLGFDGDLYILDLYENEIIRVTQNSDVISVDWSPDGEKLAFSNVDEESRNFEVYISDAFGANITRVDLPLSGGVHKGSPSWSPNGEQIAFVQWGAGVSKIHIMNSDGSDVQFLIEGDNPDWSPDGNSIVFVQTAPNNSHGDIYIINTDGTNLKQLSDDIYANGPTWSPDGKLIAFSGYDLNGENAGIYVMSNDGTNKTQVSGEGSLLPSWFPDGETILYAARRDLYLANIDMSNGALLTGVPAELSFVYAIWQPNSLD